MKLTISKSPPNYGLLVLARFSKDLDVTTGEKDSLDVNGETKFESFPVISRYFGRHFSELKLYGNDALEQTEVDHWIDFASASLSCAAEFQSSLQYLDQTLSRLTYLVGHSPSLADIAVWAVLRASPQFAGMIGEERTPTNVMRYYNFISSQQHFREVDTEYPKTEAAISKSNQVTDKKERKEEGKFVELPGAKLGEVVVRFPPEASGYLHVGHAKAALLNQYYQQTFKGKLVMRFDDTNPAKENAEFEKIILEDLEVLGIKYDMFSHTSDHFDLIQGYCEQLIRDGKAYADDTEPELMKKQREERIESKCRQNDVGKNLKMWEEMKKGSDYGQKCCIRAKMDYTSDNGCMRDPTMYRCRNEVHVSTGDKYKVYPTYDFACPIVDSVEGITHTLRTTEYHDRDNQYYWFIEVLGLRKPYIWEYSRLNLQSTVMSKRKLTWFVNEGLVDGWDDPRMPTVRGVLRRGMTVEGLKQFVVAQGGSRSVNMMEWDKIWAVNKKVIDPIVPRYTALVSDDVVTVHVKSAVNESKKVAAHPKNPAVGEKNVWYGATVMIDQADATTLRVDETVTFINWGNLIIRSIERDGEKVVSMQADLDLDNKDFKKTAKITWLTQTADAPFVPTYCYHFDHIITKPILEKTDNFKDYVNPNTKRESKMLGDPELAKLKKGDIVQLQRRGYFICDSAYQPASRHSGRESPCVLFNIPDGHQKEMPTSGSKHKTAPSGGNDKQAKIVKKSEVPPSSGSTSTGMDKPTLDKLITEQGNKIRTMKAEKASKEDITAEVTKLKLLKADYKELTGTEWSPQPKEGDQKKDPKPESPSNSNKAAQMNKGADAEEIKAKVEAQGQVVRQLKSSSKDKKAIDEAVKLLLDLKLQYKNLTGEDLVGGAQKKDTKQKKGDDKPKQLETEPDATGDAASDSKKITRLGLEVKKEENFSDWYSQVITKAEMIEYYDISGCYVLRPWSYSIWEKIKERFDGQIKEMGFENCYFPIFVSQSALNKEKEHIADFAPEVAWVTKSGKSELAEPVAIRPTSETVMYAAYARWVQSHRDLPIKLNQWCNVVRWEFKHPQPFLRTREFLWQEGHSAHAVKADAEQEVLTILDYYAEVYEKLLAVPVVKGRKTVKEQFAGADYTTTVEAFISTTGRAIQGATSHHLGQNFAKMFDISYENAETSEKSYAYQNSWGITTRTIGIVVMVHGDDRGLVLPPPIANHQVVLVPCGITAQMKDSDRAALMSEAKRLVDVLKAAGVRVHGDFRENYSPGWKYNHWELKGVPIRIELGPRDIKQKQFVAVRRDTGEKITLKTDNAADSIKTLMTAIYDSMFTKASKQLKENIGTVHDFSQFCKNLDNKKLNLAPFCGEIPCEDNLKKLSARDAVVEEGAPSMGAKGLCIPFEQPAEITDSMKCITPECTKKPRYYTLFGRSY